MKFGISLFFEYLSRIFKFHLNLTRITGTSHEDLCTFMIISRWILLRMRNVTVVEKIKARFMFNIPPPENITVYYIIWKNMVQADRPQMTIQ
jgi:hypothetical protein